MKTLIADRRIVILAGLVVAVFASQAFAASGNPNSSALAAVSRLHFEANIGQERSRAPFVGRSGARTLLIEATRIQIVSIGQTSNDTEPLQLEFVGGNRHGSFEPLEESPTRANYFRGQKNQWRTGIKEFGRLRYRGLYRNIDLVLHSDASGNALEYDFELAPGADPSTIAVRFDGGGNLRVDANGDLLMDTAGETVRQRRPVAYQEIQGTRIAVSTRYKLEDGSVATIALGDYRHDLPLTIDPALIYSTALNGSAAGDASVATATATYTDNTGHVYTYVAGNMNSGDYGGLLQTDFPIKNAYQSAPGWGFIAKMDASQTGDVSAIYVTYIEGAVYGMAIDAAGNLYVVGSGSSASLPVVNGFAAAGQSFLTKLSSDGSTVLYSTRAGGPFSWFTGVAVGANGIAYAVGATHSVDLPLVNAFQGYHSAWENESNAFLVGINTNAQGAASLVYSTYVSGPNSPVRTTLVSVAVDAAGRIYVGGHSDASFPIVNGFSSVAQADEGTPIVAVIDTTRSGSAQLLYSTFLSGGEVSALAVDTAGSLYTGAQNGLITKINPNLSGSASLLGSTFLAPEASYAVGALALDAAGNLFVAGTAGSTEFPLLNPMTPAASGLLQSVDSGSTWGIVNSIPMAVGGSGVGGLVIDSTTLPRTLYAGTSKGVFKTVDGGLNWTASNQGLTSTNVSVAQGWTGHYAQSALIMNPNNPSDLFVVTDAGVFRSIDGAQSWTLFSAGQPWTLALDGTTLYWGDGSGLFKASITGTSQSWTKLLASGTDSVAVDPITHTIYAADFGDCALWMSSTNGWTSINYGGPNCPSYVTVDTSTHTSTTPSTVWASGFWEEDIFRTPDQGATWFQAGLGGVQTPTGMIFDKTTVPATVYVANDYGSIWKSVDSGSHWQRSINGLFGALALDPMTSAGNPPTIYAFTGGPGTSTAFLAEVDNTLSSLKFSTLLGGIGGNTGANALSIDGSNKIYIAGGTASTAFPLLNGYNSSLGTSAYGTSAFLSVIGTPTLPASSSTPVTTTVGTATGSLNITMPNITGSTTTSAPTVSVTPLATTDTANFSLLNNLGAFDISTTATFSGTVTLCFQALTVNDVATFNSLTLLHVVNGVPVNITSSYNFPTRTICGTTSSFSPFVIVKGVLGQLQDLMQYVNASNLRHGIQSSLDAKLQNAESAFSSANSKDYSNVCNMMGSFINNVTAQTGQTITTAESQQMIASAKQVKATLGCK